MMMSSTLSVKLLSVALFLVQVTAQSFALDYPTKPISVVVSYSAGGNNDLRSRMLSVPVAAALGQSVITVNKPGASGNIGHDIIAKAAPDGYTLGIGAMGPLAVNHTLFAKMPFDQTQAFTPVILIEKSPLVLVTRSDKPFATVKDVVAFAKSKPGALTIGNAGNGGAHHLSAELFQQATGTSMLSIAYKGGGPASLALLSGEVDLMFEQTYAVLAAVQAGKIRALAVTSEKRLPSLPNVPTMTELGLAKVTVSNWLGIIAPKGTPATIVKEVNEAYNKALANPDIREKIEGPGNVIGGGTPEEFRVFIQAEQARWSALVKAAGIKLE
jgi:tripartite-type tricarboxylate transporter receptor subunit TctC